jgi:hypothetical protein
MAEIVFLIEDAPEGGFIARALGHSIYTEADNWEDLKREIQDAVACHFGEETLPRLIRLHYLHEEVIAA